MLPPNLCNSCARRRPGLGVGPVVCQAYPDGIPGNILAGDDHRQPRGDDLGLAYLMDPTKEVEFQLWLEEWEIENESQEV